jgi:FkbM family methyltransferase
MKQLASKLIRFLYPFGSQRTVLAGPLRGMKFIVELGNGFSYALGRGLNFDFLSPHIHPGMVIYDVGANRGQMTMFFSRIVGPNGYVHSFEPAPVPFKSLERHVAINHLANVSIHQAIVSQAAGKASFTYFEDSPSEGRLTSLDNQPGQIHNSTGTTLELPCITLDSIFQSSGRAPDLLKIDVEGAGADVLAGARQLLDSSAPSIYMELHNKSEVQALRDELLPRGYTIQTTAGRQIPDPTTEPLAEVWCFRKK